MNVNSELPDLSAIRFQRTLGYRAHGLVRGQAEFGVGKSGHYVWRKSEKGMIAFYGSEMRHAASETKRSRLGLQGEAYFDDVSLVAIAGAERSGLAGRFIAAETSTQARKLHPFSGFDVRYYPSENWLMSVGHRYWAGVHLAAVSAQTMFLRTGDLKGVASLEGRLGANGVSVVWASARFFVDKNSRSLISLQRTGQVANWLLEDYYNPGAPSF